MTLAVSAEETVHLALGVLRLRKASPTMHVVSVEVKVLAASGVTSFHFQHLLKVTAKPVSLWCQS